MILNHFPDRLFIRSALVAVVIPFMPHAAASDLLAHSSEKPLSVSAALATALTTHPLIASRQGDYQATKGELSAARWARFPAFVASARSAADGEDQTSAVVSQPLWSAGRLSGQIDVAIARSGMALADIEDARQIVLTDTASAFIDLYRAQQKAVIATSNVKEHQRLYQIIQRRVAAATSPDVDAMLAEARLSFSKSQQLQFESASAIARTQLEQLVGAEVTAIRAPKTPVMTDQTLAQIEYAALAYSPQLQQLKSQSAGLEANLKVAKSALYPQLSLNYERKFGELLFAQEREQIYLTVDFQPGAGLSARSSIAAAGARKRAAQSTIDATRRDVRRQVQIAWRERQAALLQLPPSKRLVTATAEVVESYLRQYTVGRKSWLDVLNAQREAVQAEYTLVEYETLLLMASYQLQILSGDVSALVGDPISG